MYNYFVFNDNFASKYIKDGFMRKIKNVFMVILVIVVFSSLLATVGFVMLP